MYLRFFKAYLPKMKLHQNIAFGIVQGLELILKENKALRPPLNQVLKQNPKCLKKLEMIFSYESDFDN